MTSRNDESFTHYVATHGERLMRFARVLTGNRDTAHDLLQSVLARAFLRWHHITQYEDVDSYLRRALINERTSQWRRWGRRHSVRDQLPDSIGHDEMALSDERQALLGVLRQLPRKQRAALVLRFLEDMPDADIAVILDCSVSTVRSHVARGLAGVRSSLNIAVDDPAADHALNGGSQ